MSETLSEPSKLHVTRSPTLRFRLIHLVYAVTLLGVSLGTFGPAGLLATLPFIFIWTCVISSDSRTKAFVSSVLVVLLVGPCLLPAMNTCRQAARRMQCSNNLKQIALALHNYHQKYSCFPPSYVPDENGKPNHSWRVLILPFLGHQSLYDSYDFDEPWNGPNNRKLLTRRPMDFSCPGHLESSRHSNERTSYLAVVGPLTAWPGPVGRTLSEFLHPPSDIVLVTEAAGDDILWTEPRDLEFRKAIEQLTSTDPEQHGGHRSEGFFQVSFQGRNVAMADGSVHFLSAGITRTIMAYLLTDSDKLKQETADSLEYRGTPPAKLKIGNFIRFGAWVAVAFFPLPWVWWSQKPSA